MSRQAAAAAVAAATTSGVEAAKQAKKARAKTRKLREAMVRLGDAVSTSSVPAANVSPDITSAVGGAGFLGGGVTGMGGIMAMGGMDGMDFPDPMAQEAMRRRQEAAAKAKAAGLLTPGDLD